MVYEKYAHFLISKQGIFCWNNLLSSFEEGDIYSLAETKTYFKKTLSAPLLLTQFSLLLSIGYTCGSYFQVCSILVEN